jgi:pimeloyl-ACP methyl ester carboxylesterase
MKLDAPGLPGWLGAMVPFQRYVVGTEVGKIHVMEVGEGRPVLMIHGNPTWGFLWRKVAGLLKGERLRLIMPDLLGLGLSEKPDDAGAHTLERHASAIGGVVDALGLAGVVLAVQDWGGAIGVLAFAERRERLAGLVLLNTVVGPPRPGFRPTAFHRFARMPVVSEVAFRWLGFPQNVMGLVQGDRRSVRGAVGRAYRWPLRRRRDRVAPLALARMVPDSFEHPSIAGLKRCQEVVESFRGPCAIVWGERDPVLGRVRSHLERLLPRARVTRTQAGHFLQEEVPEPIAEAIRYVAR